MAKLLKITLPDGQSFEMPDVKENREYYERINRNVKDNKDRVKIENIEENAKKEIKTAKTVNKGRGTKSATAPVQVEQAE